MRSAGFGGWDRLFLVSRLKPSEGWARVDGQSASVGPNRRLARIRIGNMPAMKQLEKQNDASASNDIDDVVTATSEACPSSCVVLSRAMNRTESETPSVLDSSRLDNCCFHICLRNELSGVQTWESNHISRRKRLCVGKGMSHDDNPGDIPTGGIDQYPCEEFKMNSMSITLDPVPL